MSRIEYDPVGCHGNPILARLDLDRLSRQDRLSSRPNEGAMTGKDETFEWDVFISHASEDNAAVARPLAELLRKRGLNVWLDENELSLGDSLRAKIDQGLARSRFGIVIVSEHFLSKDWPQRELNGLVARESQDRKVILPIWHGVDHDLIAKFSPILADRLAENTNHGLDRVADRVVAAVSPQKCQGGRHAPPSERTRASQIVTSATGPETSKAESGREPERDVPLRQGAERQTWLTNLRRLFREAYPKTASPKADLKTPVQFVIRIFATVAVVDVTGTHISYRGSAHLLKTTIRGLQEKGHRHVGLNLGEVLYVDSDGIDALVSAMTSLSNCGGSLKLFGVAQRLMDFLEIIKLRTVFDIYDDEDALFRAFQ